MEIKVLDKGFVKLIDSMGDDKSAVEAARVSFSNHTNKEDRTMTERDKKLASFLMDEGHFTPFEHLIIKVHVKTPIFVARQWFRHRLFSYNEISRRYTSKQADEFYIPDHIRTQDEINKQGSIKTNQKELEKSDIALIEASYMRSYQDYKKLLEHGVAREMARMVMPFGQYTEFYMTGNIRSYMNFLNLRADSHAQWEIQEYAKALAEIFKNVYPYTYEYFIKNHYNGDILKGDVD
jgi:thymidylate synthase (FAD)